MSKKTKKYEMVKPIDTVVDHAYQRDQDEARVERMAKAFRADLLGVPVLHRRRDGALVRIDGQHRLAAAILAGHGDVPVMCEIHEGLALDEEARLFLSLNGHRSAIRVIDRFQAKTVAKDETALAIVATLASLKLQVKKNRSKNSVCAIQAIEKAHRNGNLLKTMQALKSWCDGEPDAFDRQLVSAMSFFFLVFPDVKPLEIGDRLRPHAPSKVVMRIKRAVDAGDGNTEQAGAGVFREIYNERRSMKSRLPPIHVALEAMRERAA